MSLEKGTLLGAYRITGPLGAGGMGEVWAATDERLGRDVAIKVITSGKVTAQALGRFEKEARAASALNHPNIITIHDIGEQNGIHYIAMEKVDGRSLRSILASGPVPLRKLLQIAAQLTSGLAAAHRAGIVHRDLKPDNVMVTDDGLVKILDFGLAKQVIEADPDMETLAREPGLTRPGTILGTVSYMSPEQASGLSVDFRSDQFSVGTILYEAITGRRPFDRATTVETMSAIVRDDADPLGGKAGVPAPFAWVVKRCLAKEPRERYASTDDLAHDLETMAQRISEASGTIAPVTATPRKKLRWIMPAAAGLAAGLAIGAVIGLRDTKPAPAPSARSEPVRMRSITHSGRDYLPTASPEGRTIAFVSDRGGLPQIWVQDIKSGSEVRLTDGPDSSPRFSSDGSVILFVRTDPSGLSLYRVPTVGGEPRKLVSDAREGAWSPDGQRIAFYRITGTGTAIESSVFLSDASGSSLRELATIDDSIAYFRWSPDGSRIAVSGTSGNFQRTIYVVDTTSGVVTPTAVTNRSGAASAALWLNQNEILIALAETVGFGTQSSLNRLDIQTGALQRVLWVRGVVNTIESLPGGRIVLGIGDPAINLREFDLRGSPGDARWISRGRSQDRQPVYSPDGEWVLFSSNRAGNIDLWKTSKASGSIVRLTDDETDDWDPAFTPDGKGILWSSKRSGNFEIWMADADGSGARQVTQDGFDAENPTMTPDGAWIVYSSFNPAKQGIWKIRPDGSDAVRIIDSPFAVVPDVSPDGSKVAWVELYPPIGVTLKITDVRSSGVLATQKLPDQPVSFVGGVFGRSRWLPGSDGVAYVDIDRNGAIGISVQRFESGKLEARSKRSLVPFIRDANAESFAISRDGRFATIAYFEPNNTVVMIENLGDVIGRDTKGSEPPEK